MESLRVLGFEIDNYNSYMLKMDCFIEMRAMGDSNPDLSVQSINLFVRGV